MKKFAALLISALSLVSCLKDVPVLFTFQEMVTVEGGFLVNDEGVRYMISNETYHEITETIMGMKRVFIHADALKQVSVGYDYEIRVNAYQPVEYRPCVVMSEITEDKYGTDPVKLFAGFANKKYINLSIQISYLNSATEFPGRISMLYDDIASTRDTLQFELRNAADGKSWANTEFSESQISFYTLSDIYSFPIDQYVPEGKDSFVVKVRYKWFEPDETDDQKFSRSTTMQSDFLKVPAVTE